MQIESEKMWQHIGKLLHLGGHDLYELEQDYWDGVWNTELLEYVRSLSADYKLGIISDAESNAREMVKSWVSEDLFDVIVFSSEEGVCKPDVRLFQTALERLRTKPENAVFVDDRVVNVQGAEKLGIHAIQYESTPQLLRELEDYFDIKKD